MKGILLTIVAGGLIFFSGCRVKAGCEDDNLTIPKTAHDGSQLRLNGYYYRAVTPDEVLIRNIYYLYHDGVVFAPGKVDGMPWDIPAANWGNEYDELKYNWGAYKIDGNRIEIEYWRYSHCGMHTIYESGNLLNDSTFVINTRESRANGGIEKVEQVDLRFQFHPNEKPDGANSFVK